MIIVENRKIRNRDFTYTYSDLSVYIQNENGQKYADAYDLVEYPHTYTETDEKIETEEEEVEITED